MFARSRTEGAPIADAVERGGRDAQDAVDIVASRAARTIVLVVQPGRTVT